MFKLNQENIAFGQFDWSGRFPEGRTSAKSGTVSRAFNGESWMPG